MNNVNGPKPVGAPISHAAATTHAGKYESGGSDSRRPRLLAVTATGPVYLQEVTLAVIPFTSALALLQELATRIRDDKAEVASSLARRVKGRSAYLTWLYHCARISMGLAATPPAWRLHFLRTLIDYMHRKGDVGGLEPVMAATLNATWPWMSVERTRSVARNFHSQIRRSKFIEETPALVCDPFTRSLTMVPPGQLSKIDIEGWLDWRSALDAGSGGMGPGGFGGLGSGGMGPVDQLGGNVGAGGVFSGGDAGSRGFNGLGALGGLGPLDFNSPGGPFGAGSFLGTGGASGFWGDAAQVVGKGLQAGGAVATAIGGALIVAGVVQEATIVLAVTGGGTMITGAEVVVGGLAAGVVGLAVEQWGKARNETKDTQAPPIVTIPTVVIDDSPPPDDEPKPGDSKPGDLYPDPDGGGSPSPNRLPAGDGSGGGRPDTRPNSIWDESFGGGRPNSIWDENGGGGGPNSIWDENGGGGRPNSIVGASRAVFVTGDGLRAAFVQIGPSTFRF